MHENDDENEIRWGCRSGELLIWTREARGERERGFDFALWMGTCGYL